MKMKSVIKVCTVLILGSTMARGQGVAINTTNADPDPSAVLDVSSTTQGMLIPRMTAALRGLIVSPVTGLMVYQTDAPAGFYFYNGSSWISLSTTTGTVTNASVVSANGFAGSVATSTTTPAITLSTTVTGMLKGDGTAISSAGSSDLPNIALTGNVTGSASGGSIATTIASNAVTYDKMQNVSNTSRLLGSSASSTAVQEIVLGSGLSMSGNTLSGTANPMTTTGDMIIGNPGSTPARLAVGGGTQYLGVSGGIPAWTNPAITPTASTLAGWDANKNMSANNVLEGYRTIVTSGSTISMLFNDVKQMVLTGVTAQTVNLPGASTVLGQRFIIKNNSTATTSVNSSAGNAVTSLPPGTSAEFMCVTAGGTTAASWAVVNSGGSLFNVRYFTTGTNLTYTPTIGTTAIYVVIVGAGGGGGGQWFIYLGGGGGGAGAVCYKYINNVGALTGTYTVGVGGAGGTAVANPSTAGSTGGSTTFTFNGVTYTAGGGGGGGTYVGVAAVPFPAIGGSGGVATNGDINAAGASGNSGFGNDASTAASGAGGSTAYGGGGNGKVNVNSVGNPGTGFGSGGGGGTTFNANGAVGGVGANGMIIVYEYH